MFMPPLILEDRFLYYVRVFKYRFQNREQDLDFAREFIDNCTKLSSLIFQELVQFILYQPYFKKHVKNLLKLYRTIVSNNLSEKILCLILDILSALKSAHPMRFSHNIQYGLAFQKYISNDHRTHFNQIFNLGNIRFPTLSQNFSSKIEENTIINSNPDETPVETFLVNWETKKQEIRKVKARKFQVKYKPPAQHITIQDFIPKGKAIFVDNVFDQNWSIAVSSLSQASIIGFDAEWKPFRPTEKVAVFQIACSTHAFAFDVPKLKQEPEFQQLMGKLFSDRSIQKVGHTSKEDFLKLQRVLKEYNYEISLQKHVDISRLFRKTLNSTKSSLKYIAEKIFSKHFSKKEQKSNWELRPLSDNQIHYAALDALVVIKIYEILNKQEEIERLDKIVDKNPPKKPKTEKKLIDRSDNPNQITNPKNLKSNPLEPCWIEDFPEILSLLVYFYREYW